MIRSTYYDIGIMINLLFYFLLCVVGINYLNQGSPVIQLIQIQIIKIKLEIFIGTYLYTLCNFCIN